jgi:GntR family transcriptional regulator
MNNVIEGHPSGRQLPMHARIREILRAGIRSGSFRPNDRLPSEKELMASHGVSRITVRHALGELEKDGVIYRISGKGSYVAKPAPVQDLTKLQGFAESMSRLGYQTLNQLVSLITLPAPGDVSSQLGIPVGTPVTEIRRIRNVDQEPVSLDVTYVATALGERLAKEDLITRDIFSILESDYGIALGHADLTISTIAAPSPLTDYLRVDAGAPILHLERLTHTKEGVPLEFDRIYYRGDSFSYRLRITRG